jgi:hypothetical protein
LDDNLSARLAKKARCQTHLIQYPTFHSGHENESNSALPELEVSEIQSSALLQQQDMSAFR